MSKSRQITTILKLAGLTAAVLSVCACEPRTHASSAPPPPSGPQDRGAARGLAAVTEGEAPQRVRRAAPPLFNGKPMWADNRRGSSEENAQYQFEHRGADVGAHDLQDYLKKVHAFFDHPPKDAESIVRASNGDLLIYSESANLFGVIRKDGAPRLLMKPPTGKAYWEAQKAEGSTGARGGTPTR
jgi:pyocin large subunit-like protein